MGAELATVATGAIEKALIQGDLKDLTESQRVAYYQRVCESVGLNPLTKPFEYLWLKGQGGTERLVLYATRSCTDQLRHVHEVTLTIVDRKMLDGVYVVTAKATMPNGRADESTGAVPLEKEGGEWKDGRNGKRFFAGNGTFDPLRGESLANALMKAETKAKRRVTLSICGLGLLDESEVESIPGARRAEPEHEPAPERPALPPRQEPPAPTNGHPTPNGAAKPQQTQPWRGTLTQLAAKLEGGSVPATGGDLHDRAAWVSEVLTRIHPAFPGLGDLEDSIRDKADLSDAGDWKWNDLTREQVVAGWQAVVGYVAAEAKAATAAA